MVKWMRIALPPKIGGTLFEVTWLAGASETTCYIFSRLALPPVVRLLPVIFWREDRKCRTGNIIAGKELVQSYTGRRGKREERKKKIFLQEPRRN